MFANSVSLSFVMEHVDDYCVVLCVSELKV